MRLIFILYVVLIFNSCGGDQNSLSQCTEDVFNSKIFPENYGLSTAEQPELRVIAYVDEFKKTGLLNNAMKKVLGSNYDERIRLMEKGELPLAFKNKEQFSEFKKEFNDLLVKNGLDGYWGIQGTSTTFISLNPYKNFYLNYFLNCPKSFDENLIHFYDKQLLTVESLNKNITEQALQINSSDIDLHIKSRKLAKELINSGARLASSRYFNNRDTENSVIGLKAFKKKWGKIINREIGAITWYDHTADRGYLNIKYAYKISLENDSEVDPKAWPLLKNATTITQLDNQNLSFTPNLALSEPQVIQALKQKWTAEKTPNIIFFLVDTLRKDYVNPETTPFLTELSFGAINPMQTIAGATATHHALFSMFFSRAALEREHMINTLNWSIGSPALNIFKKLGYKMHAFAYPAFIFCKGIEPVAPGTAKSRTETAHVNLLFGDKGNLLDTCAEWKPKYYWGASSGQRDMNTAKAFIDFVKKQTDAERKEKNFYFIYLFAPHMPYGRIGRTPKLQYPAANSDKDMWNLERPNNDLTMANSRNYVINSYTNAAKSVDYTMKTIYDSLEPELGTFSKSIVLFVSDHGEQMYNKTHPNKVGHGGYPLKEQISVPFFMRFPDKYYRSDEYNSQLASSLDIFPTILDRMNVRDANGTTPQGHRWFLGRSLFDKKRNCAITVRPNRDDNPYILSLFDGEKKLISTISSSTAIPNPSYFSTDKLRVVKNGAPEAYLGVYDSNDEPILPQLGPNKIMSEFNHCLYLIGQ